MTSRPERISQQPTSTDRSRYRVSADQTRCRTSDRRHSPTRSGRKALLDFILFLAVAALLMVWTARTLIGRTPRPEIPVAIHTITPDCMSAEDIARAYGWTEDWRDYMIMIEWHNPDLDWGRLHYGDRLLVPDYRSHQNAQRLRAGEIARAPHGLQPSAGEGADLVNPENLRCSHIHRHQRLGVDPVAASGCTQGRPGVIHRSSSSRLLSRAGPPLHNHNSDDSQTSTASNRPSDR